MNDRIAELRARLDYEGTLDDTDIDALLDCAEALKKCVPLLHQNFPSNDNKMAHAAAVKALAKLNGEPK